MLNRFQDSETKAHLTGGRMFLELFESQVEHAPGAVAVVCGEHSLSYGELNARANELAHRLITAGVGAGCGGGGWGERAVQMLVGLLGVWKAGGAYLPLDPAYPVERLRLMIEEARPKLLLSGGAGVAGPAPAGGGGVEGGRGGVGGGGGMARMSVGLAEEGAVDVAGATHAAGVADAIGAGDITSSTGAADR